MRDDDNELALRSHIRGLLLEYAYTHLTTDHVQYSEFIVSEILAKILRPIPTHGPGELALPADPFETLKAILKFDALPAYDEVWQPGPEALQLVKETLIISEGKPRTQTVWEEDDNFDYESMPHRSMTPMLSRSSRKKTPCLGKYLKSNAKASSLAASLLLHGVRPVTDAKLPEDKLLKLNDCLDLKLTIDASMHANILDLQQQIPFLSHPIPRSLPKYAADFLRSNLPEYRERLKPMSPPIFSRERRVRPSKGKEEPGILGPIKPVPLEVLEVDPDIANESMKLVDGWETIPTSASTPSLSTGTSEPDELEGDADFWMPSSSDGVLTSIEILQAAKMEEPIFPRSERPRASKTSRSDEKPKPSLSTFLHAHFPSRPPVRILTAPSSDDAIPKADFCPPRSVSAVSLSMLGQPPSESDVSAQLGDSVGNTFDKDIRRILKVYGGGEGMKPYRDLIMDERLDETGTMFIEVPSLAPPNEYLRIRSKQAPWHKLSVASRELIEQSTSPIPRFQLPVTLKKATGLKSLNLELSWRPFSFGSKIPTHAELVGVDSVFPTTNNVFSSNGEVVSQDSIENFMADLGFPTELEDDPFSSDSRHIPQGDIELDSRILKGIHSDADFATLDARFNPNRDFDDIVLLIPRSDYSYLRSEPSQPSYGHASTNKILTFNDSQSYETSEVSSAITPELSTQLPPTQYADENRAYFNPGFYMDQASLDHCLDDYDDYQHPEDLDASRKKRRLNSAEVNALGAIGAMSQFIPTTVNPKDLILPQAISVSDEHQFNNAASRMMSAYNSEMAFLSSQSQSLSLSLNEDNTSQDFNFVKSVNDILGGSNADVIETPFGESEALAAFNEIAGVDKVALLNNQFDGSSSPHQSQSQIRPNLQPYPVSPGQPPLTRHVVEQRRSLLELKSGVPNLQQPDENASETAPDETEANKQLRSHLTSSSAFQCDKDRLSMFLQLRGRKEIESRLPPPFETERLSQNDAILHDAGHASDNLTAIQTYASAPPDLLSYTRAFSLSEPWLHPTTDHSYIVSVQFVQQRALVHALQSSRCRVRLVERDVITPSSMTHASATNTPQTHSADISVIVGPDAAVVFFPLPSLPSQTAYKTLLDALALHSWRFSSILLVFITFSRSQLFRVASSHDGIRDGPSSYSPPALKAARRVRRDLALREGTGEKRTSCTVDLAFADDVEQAAMFVRAFGDSALRDSAIDFTCYIGEEEQEGERDLTEVDGMNVFCATAILRCCTLEQFLEMPPQQRLDGFADVVGKGRIELVNAVLTKRMQDMDIDLPSSSEYGSSLNA